MLDNGRLPYQGRIAESGLLALATDAYGSGEPWLKQYRVPSCVGT